MTEIFTVGDKVTYRDSLTGKTRCGVITSVCGSAGTIRTITKAEIEIVGADVNHLIVRSKASTDGKN
jgi:hypothetical protein